MRRPWPSRGCCAKKNTICLISITFHSVIVPSYCVAFRLTLLPLLRPRISKYLSNTFNTFHYTNDDLMQCYHYSRTHSAFVTAKPADRRIRIRGYLAISVTNCEIQCRKDAHCTGYWNIFITVIPPQPPPPKSPSSFIVGGEACLQNRPVKHATRRSQWCFSFMFWYV
jgi:hypothetical protein